MKKLPGSFTLLLLVIPALSACSGGQSETVTNHDGPVVQVYHPPT
jgi:hypothetical protein